MKVYLVDVGVLLSKEHEEFEKYAIVYDKRYGYYDEDQFYTRTKEEAIEYVKKYVEEGVDLTYGIISNATLPDDYDFENDSFGPEKYELSDVIYSIAKFDGKIKENFVIK